jgi:putative phosphoribosyl transferase
MENASFANRIDAGEQLAQRLDEYRGTPAVVVGLARGGVVVGYGVATTLDLPLRALVVRKIEAPGNPELAIGAVSETGVQWLDPYIVRETGATRSYIDEATTRAETEARRRQALYSEIIPIGNLEGKTAIIVDDGIATGATVRVGARSARDLGASRIIVATPVASPHAVRFLAPDVDGVVTLLTPALFLSVGTFYVDFTQTNDAEVLRILRDANRRERERS